ncbi:MAG: PQQ-binding-like beta-propeller repeat protein [Pirellulales bacterium]
MDLLHLLERTIRALGCRRGFVSLLRAAFFLPAIAWYVTSASAQVQINNFGRWTTIQQDSVAGVYLPTDRALSRAIARARERLANREYHEALAFLHGVLSREEDSFLERLDGEREQTGLKSTARRLIGELPPEGHDAYELLHGATARRQLEAALQSGDQNGVANVVRQFYHTSAGYEAALVLAQMEADQGHRLAAAQLYQELIDAPRAAVRFEPQLSVMAAINHLAAGKPEAAAATMRSLIERRPSTEIVLSGQTTTAPAATADLLAWLTRLVGEPSDVTTGEINWLTQRGDPTRNVQAPGGPPHLRARWQARVVNDPAVEAYLTGRRDDYAQRGVVVMPGARPVAVGDVVIMRTPENVVAVDWQTGKRIWETREDDELKVGETSDLRQQMDQQQWIEQGNPLDERVWDDALVNSLSSDGERVFVLRGITVPEEERVMGWQVAPGFGRVGGEITATTNQLAAYDLTTQGKLVWELDGSRATGPLDGAFFLGAPVAIDDTLYVMAEVRSAVYLLALDPATGKVRWQQQLVGLEQGIALDPVRRRAAATPSYDGGILVCPTAASAVIAIDVVKREFAWVYRYPREPQTPAEARHLLQQTGQPQIARANDRWLDSVAVIAEGRVLVTPPESAELHCLDLKTGKLAWKQRQGDALFVGGVDRGNVLLVGAEKVQAVRMSDGMPAWDQEFAPLPVGALPAGHGYLSKGRYYLPLTTGEIASIDIANGELTPLFTAQPDAALGNLISYRGSILSQSPLMLDKFEQLEALKQRAEAALAKNPDDATALRELAELKRADGDRLEAVKLLKRAFELAPNDPLAQEMLAELLLEALSADYATFRDDVPLVSRLIRDHEQQIELMRIEARGLEELGQRLAAWDAYMRLADFTTEKPAYLRASGDYRVRSDRWIAGRLDTLWSEASAEERTEISARASARRPSTENPRTAAEMHHYLAHLDPLPGADEVRHALARFLVERSRAQEAEIELLELSASNDRDIQAAAAALTKKLSSDLLPGDEAEPPQRSWPRGQVDAELLPAAAPTDPGGLRAPAERQAGYRLLRIEQDFWPAPSAIQWFVAMDCSELVARNALGDDVFHLPVDQNNLARQYRDSGLVHAARLGQLLYVAIGGQVMAIDSRNAARGIGGDLLWQTDPLGRYSIDPAQGGRAVGIVVPRASRRPVYHAWSGRKRLAGAVGPGVCSLGPVTPRGVVFQENNELKCVDPLSGELLWSRSDLPAGCELFGDKELVFAADVNGRVAHVIRMVDGRLIGKRELPQHEWLLTAGRKIAELGFQINREGRVLSVRIRDTWSQDVLHEAEHPIASRLAVVEPDAIAIYEPSGKFQLIDARSGKVLIDAQLQAVDDLQFIQTMRCGDELFLFVSNQPQQQYKPIGQFDYPLINGLVYAFSMNSGEALWPGPAVVRNRGIALSQAEDIPLLVFAERKMIRDATTGGGSQLRLLCLDKRTGQTVYRNDQLPDTSLTRFRVRAERHAKPVVALEMSAGKIQWTFTDRPRPPQPPASDDLEAPREEQERGLRGIGRRVTGALRGVLQQQADGGQTPSAANPPAAQPENAKATDDD